MSIANDVQGYESLSYVLNRAYQQAASGKGKERHAQGAPFDHQPMQRLCDLYGRGFALGQAAKKIQEAQRLSPERAVAEMLGAINYIAGAIIHLEAEGRVHANDNVASAALGKCVGTTDGSCMSAPHCPGTCRHV